jgi:hypothetical protein
MGTLGLRVAESAKKKHGSGNQAEDGTSAFKKGPHAHGGKVAKRSGNQEKRKGTCSKEQHETGRGPKPG